MNNKSAKETIHWFEKLSDGQRADVHTWLELNNPPENWHGSALDYAYWEMAIWGVWWSWK